jgi:bifunctional non-homologous end joining protein LigD
VSLERYKHKRDFARTPEPAGELGSSEAGPAARTGARPSAPAATGSGGPVARFVVQRHRARNLHYDFRLEIDGVLVSWAVPKGLTLDPAVRRGAFRVEDHPIEYFDFEGVIPAGQYGAGDVIVWDWGTYRAELTDDARRALESGELKFGLDGEKLRGRFTIVRTRRRGATRDAGAGSAGHSEREEWLLIKKRDGAALSGWDIDSLPLSVKSGRTNDEVAAGMPPVSAGRAPIAATPGDPMDGSRAATVAAELPGARLARMPDFIEPMKATPSDRPFSDPAWLYELKWDGYRVQAHVRAGRAAFFTRRGLDAAGYFPELAGPPTWIAAGEAILDGEVVALNAAGEPDFRLLQARPATARRRGKAAARPTKGDDPGEQVVGGTGVDETGAGGAESAGAGAADAAEATLVYEVFDLLFLEGVSLLGVALESRKRLLRDVLLESPTVRYAGHLDDGEAFYRAVSERGLEGIVAKLRRGLYTPGRRSPSWLKVKCRKEQEFVIVGWTPRSGTENDLGALILGVQENGGLRPAGRAGTGFDARERRRLLALMAPLRRSASPLRPTPNEPGVRWVAPRLVARVEYAEWPAGGLLRAPSYKGLDPDADPAKVVREQVSSSQRAVRAAESGEPAQVRESASVSEPGEEPESAPGMHQGVTRGAEAHDSSAASPEELAALEALPATGGFWTVAGRQLKLSNLDKPLWPAEGIVKRDLIRYYSSVARFALPYLRDRALTVFRHPNGIDRPGFWQKQIPGHAPAWIDRWSWESESAGERRDYIVADSQATLAWLANEAAIDLHPTTFRTNAPDRPTWAFVDIDPGERTTWDDLLQLARLYRTALDHLGVSGFPKVTGQRGIQIWIPIRPAYTFGQTRDWVGELSRAVAAIVPELVSWEWEKTRRAGLARLDYTQNAPNKTLVAPYAVRPAQGAPVSAPISWAELDDPNLRPNGWTILTIFERLARVGDLFEPALALEQDLPAL